MIELLTSTFGVSANGAIYTIAALSSIAVELSAFVRDIAAFNGKRPPRYTMLYLVVRALFALIAAGPLAVLLADTALTAFYIGASAPLIFDRAAAGIQNNGSDNPRSP